MMGKNFKGYLWEEKLKTEGKRGKWVYKASVFMIFLRGGLAGIYRLYDWNSTKLRHLQGSLKGKFYFTHTFIIALYYHDIIEYPDFLRYYHI